MNIDGQVSCKEISSDFVESVIKTCKFYPRNRRPILVHNSYEEKPQRFVNCMTADSYIRPHKHKNEDQWEIIVWISGEMLVVIFEDDGTILKKFELGYKNGRIIEIKQNQFHSLIPLRECAYFEIRNCKFEIENDREYAEWAPVCGSTKVAEFVSWVKRTESGIPYAKSFSNC